jgi:hypothetical protein
MPNVKMKQFGVLEAHCIGRASVELSRLSIQTRWELSISVSTRTTNTQEAATPLEAFSVMMGTDPIAKLILMIPLSIVRSQMCRGMAGFSEYAASMEIE